MVELNDAFKDIKTIDWNPMWDKIKETSNAMASEKERILIGALGCDPLLIQQTPYDWAQEEINTFMQQSESNMVEIYSYNDVVCVFTRPELEPLVQDGKSFRGNMAMKYKIIRKSDIIKTV